MPANPAGSQHPLADFAPALVGYPSEVLFGQVWERPQLPPSDRSLITVAALTAGGDTDRLSYHLRLARDNGLSEEELIAAITRCRPTPAGPRPCPRRPSPARSSAASEPAG
jgi:4-carboxymuconolactone decarboxylase